MIRKTSVFPRPWLFYAIMLQGRDICSSGKGLKLSPDPVSVYADRAGLAGIGCCVAGRGRRYATSKTIGHRYDRGVARTNVILFTTLLNRVVLGSLSGKAD